MTKLMETQVAELFSRGLEEEKNITVGANHTDKIATVAFEAVSTLLRDVKTKECPSAFIFDDLNGDMIVGAVVEFHPSEDPKQTGNWSYIWTFDKAMIPEGAKQYTITNQQTHPYFVSIAGNRFHMGFEEDSYICILHNYFFKILSKYLEDNATEKVTEIELDGIFQARSAVEDGEVVKSIEVIGETKSIIKSDSDIEVK